MVRAPLYRSVMVCRYASTTSVASSTACCSSADRVELGDAEALALASALAEVLGVALGLVAASGSESLEQPAINRLAATAPARARAVWWIMFASSCC